MTSFTSVWPRNSILTNVSGPAIQAVQYRAYNSSQAYQHVCYHLKIIFFQEKIYFGILAKAESPELTEGLHTCSFREMQPHSGFISLKSEILQQAPPRYLNQFQCIIDIGPADLQGPFQLYSSMILCPVN